MPADIFVVNGRYRPGANQKRMLQLKYITKHKFPTATACATIASFCVEGEFDRRQF
jgi:hypothetical protein